MDYESESRRIKSLDEFEAAAKGFLQVKYSESLPQEVSEFIDSFRRLGPQTFPDRRREGHSILIRTPGGLSVRVTADIGMYWTDPQYGHMWLEVDNDDRQLKQ